MKKQLDVVFKGRVQGVGFRYETVRLLEGLPIVGYVMNEWDGGVRLVMEGEEEMLKKALAFMHDSRLGKLIYREDIRWKESLEEFDVFSIRYH